MCGINGFNFEDKKLIKSMNKTIKHRGPDDEGTYTGKNISLGHLRLSIQDLSNSGHQPMNYVHKKHELEIVFNGEIYNFLEIREELQKKGYTFKSKTDTEVILASYLEWGEGCVKKFNGMWAFCIYDKQKKQLFLSRDRFGKKPLYYYFKSDKFIFSSELKAILKADIKKQINKHALEEIFTYRHTFGEKTILENVFNFYPAHNMVFDLKTSKIKSYMPYYKLKIIPKKKISFEKAKKKAYELILRAVKRRMVSDVPVAALLSGGLDSSIVTYFAKEYNENLNTFSIGFDTTNELSYAKLLAEKLGTSHYEFKVTKDNVLDYLEDMVYHMDEPIGADPGFLPVFVLSKNVVKHNRVVLSGDGADEIFTGYDRYKLFYYGRYLKHFAFFCSENQILKRLRSMRGKNDFDAFVEVSRVFETRELKKMGLKERYDDLGWPLGEMPCMTKGQVYDINNFLLKDLFMKADKMSSAFGLEQRTPFMDHELVEFALSLPIGYKLRLWDEKHILKQAFKHKLPEEIYKRRKHGFNVPIDYWFENVLGERLKRLLKENDHGLYNKGYVYDLLEQIKGKGISGGFKSRNVVAQKLWTVLVFEMWHGRFIGK